MAYVEIIPKTSASEQRLITNGVELADHIAQVIKTVLEVPDHDIIVELRRCTTITFNALAVDSGSAPDAIVKIATSDLHLQPRFEGLTARIVDLWDARFGPDFRVEVWASPIAAWNCNLAND